MVHCITVRAINGCTTACVRLHCSGRNSLSLRRSKSRLKWKSSRKRASTTRSVCKENAQFLHTFVNSRTYMTFNSNVLTLIGSKPAPGLGHFFADRHGAPGGGEEPLQHADHDFGHRLGRPGELNKNSPLDVSQPMCWHAMAVQQCYAIAGVPQDLPLGAEGTAEFRLIVLMRPFPAVYEAIP